MQFSLNTLGGKLIASTAVLGAAAGIAGLGTFGSFTSTTSSSQAVSSGTVKIDLNGPSASSTNGLSLAAAGLVPGDTVQRLATLTNSGTQDLGTLALTTAATTSSKLDTDPTNGLKLSVQACNVPWTGSAGSYTCTGTTTAWVTSRTPIAGTVQLAGQASSIVAGKSDFLLVSLNLPSTADDTFQGLTSTIGFTFNATQRAAKSS